MSSLSSELLGELQSIPAIDTHQHLRLGHNGQDNLAAQVWDFERLFANGVWRDWLNDSLRSLRPEPASFLEKIRWLRTTSSFRSTVTIPLRDLYGCDVHMLDASMVQRIDEQIRDNYRHGPHEWCRQLFQRANIAHSLKVNVSLKYFEGVLPGLSSRDRTLETSLFSPIWNVGAFIATDPWQDHADVANRFDVSLLTLDGYLSLIDALFPLMRQYGIVAIKTTLANHRTLHVEFVSLDEARSLYQQKASGNKRLHDYFWSYIAKKAAEYDIPFVIHTGINRGNLDPSGCNPSLLHDLLTHPDCFKTRFVLIHTGYPYSREMVLLAWNTPNVFIDFVVLPNLGFETAVQVIGEFLEWAPLHKFTMGTDCKDPETAYGCMVQAREVLAHVLARKCELGLWTEETALDAGKAILQENACLLYDLKRPDVGLHGAD